MKMPPLDSKITTTESCKRKKCAYLVYVVAVSKTKCFREENKGLDSDLTKF
jgi:hypothetical protein